MALACLVILLSAAPLAVLAGGPPPCEPPEGYVPPEVDVRIVGLMQGQRVAVGSAHDLRAEALDVAGAGWGERFDWYVDGEHLATGPALEWTVMGPLGDHRVTLVVSSGDDAVWCHVDVSADTPGTGPPAWLGLAVRVLPLLAMAVWLALVHRQMARRRDPPGGSG